MMVSIYFTCNYDKEGTRKYGMLRFTYMFIK